MCYCRVSYLQTARLVAAVLPESGVFVALMAMGVRSRACRPGRCPGSGVLGLVVPDPGHDDGDDSSTRYYVPLPIADRTATGCIGFMLTTFGFACVYVHVAAQPVCVLMWFKVHTISA